MFKARNDFWNSVEKGIKDSSPSESTRNNLKDITNATKHIKLALTKLDAFLNDNNDFEKSKDYYFHRGYLFTLNYYRDSKDTSKENAIKANTLMNLGCAVADLEKLLENKNKKDIAKIKIKEGLIKLEQEAELLLNSEIQKLSLKDIIKNVQDKKGYLRGILGHNSKSKIDLSDFLLNHLESTL